MTILTLTTLTTDMQKSEALQKVKLITFGGIKIIVYLCSQ